MFDVTRSIVSTGANEQEKYTTVSAAGNGSGRTWQMHRGWFRREMQPHLCCCEQACPAPHDNCFQNGFNNTCQNATWFPAGSCGGDTSHATVRQLKMTCNKIQVSTSSCWAEQVFWPNGRNCTSLRAQKMMRGWNARGWEISMRITNNHDCFEKKQTTN